MTTLRRFYGCLFLTLALLAAAPLAAQELLPAPYQVEAVVRYFGEHQSLEEGLQQDLGQVLVDFGSAADRPPPGDEAFAEMTFVGTKGAAEGLLSEIKKGCSYLCGPEEGETCHYIAVYDVGRAVESLGTLLVAIPGHHEIERLEGVVGEEDPRVITHNDILRADLARPVWPVQEGGPAYRLRDWKRDEQSLVLDIGQGQDVGQTLEDESCEVSWAGEVIQAQCRTFAMLISRRQPLLVSIADYNMPRAEVVASFEVQDRKYSIVRLGLKAQTVFGLLTRTPKGWQALIRPRDYPQLC